MLQIQSFTFNPLQENTYLLYNEFKHCIIIDPGCYYDEERDQLQQFISGNGLTPFALVNTHCHLDHVFGNKFVAETYNLTLQLHQKEAFILEHAPTFALMYNLPFDNYAGDQIFLKEGDEFVMDDDKLSIIETPGHSPGSICFYSEKQHFIIAGDVLFNRSIGRTDLPLGNHEDLVKSIQAKLFTLPGETVVHPGHGEPTTIGEEKMYNPFFQ